MAIYPSSVTQNGVTATLTLSGSTVTVTVSGTNLYWRINGTNYSGTHGTHYIPQNKNASGTFVAEDGLRYAFQVCSSSGTWSNGASFDVSFGSDSGDSGMEYHLWVKDAEGATVTVYKYYEDGDAYIDETNNRLEGILGGELWYGYPVQPYDYLKFDIVALPGYALGETESEGLQYDESLDAWCFIPDLTEEEPWLLATAKKTYNLSISQGTGTTISVKRNGVTLSNGATITDGDSLVIAISANTGYDLRSRSHNDGTYTVSGNMSVSATATVKAYKLSISAGKGSSVTVKRTSSPKQGASTGNLSSGATIYHSDVLQITFAAGAGYEITTHTVNGSTFTSGNTHTVTANVTVIAITGTSGLVYIDNGTTLEAYQIYKDNGSSWDQYIPYIDNGSGWDMCN